MKLLELKAERVRHGYTQKQIAKLINKSLPAYNQKENGKRAFTDNEKKLLIDIFNLTPTQTMNIFFSNPLNLNDNLVHSNSILHTENTA